MDFFKSLLSEDLEPSDREEDERSSTTTESPTKPLKEEEHEEEEEVEQNPDEEEQNPDDESDLGEDPSPGSSDGGGGAWSFGGLIKTFASKSESVLQNYRRDFEDFSSGLKKETSVIREVATRVVKDLPDKLEVGATVAQESLESVGQAIDDIGSTVWRGTAEIISHGKETLRSVDNEGDYYYYSDNQQISSNSNMSSKKYSRFEAQLYAIQTDLNTYCEDPEDLESFNKWKSGFVLEEKGEEMMSLFGENEVMEGAYLKLVPNEVDRETFWIRYFYRVYKLKQIEDARATLVKRAISGDEDEDLSWDVDDDDDEEEEVGGEANLTKELEKVTEIGEKSSDREVDEKGPIVESVSGNASDGNQVLEGNVDLSELNRERLQAEGDEKVLGDTGESSKDSDISVVSSQPSLPEEEDLSWDEIEDLGSNDEKKVTTSGRSSLDKQRLIVATTEDEDLSWDIEDDEDAPVKS